MIRILSIDPSLSRCGYASSCPSYPAGHIMTKPSAGPHDGLYARYDEIIRRLTRVTNTMVAELGGVDLVVIEAPIIATGSMTGAMETNGLHWVLRYWAWKKGWLHVDIANGTRRKWAAGDRPKLEKKQDKEQVMLLARDEAREDHDLVLNNNDEADAWLMLQIAQSAYTFVDHVGRPLGPIADKLPKHRREVLAVPQWPELTLNNRTVRPDWSIHRGRH